MRVKINGKLVEDSVSRVEVTKAHSDLAGWIVIIVGYWWWLVWL